jgi:hypothetical protein
MRNYTEHKFYCMKCGKPGIPIMRPDSRRHECHHRKKLFCLTCKTEVNHIECSNLDEINEFLTNFEKGVYIDESEASISFVRSCGMR